MKYIILLLLVVACSSAKKDAQELSEKGQYEQAVAKWLEAYKKDPTDQEVIDGLKEAQDHVVNDRLVRVRNLRNTKNYLEALSVLKGLVEVEAEWKYKLDFNSANFQGQETTILWKYQKERFQFLIDKKQPLAAAFYFEDYKHVFSHIKAEDLKTELVKIKQSGKSLCLDLRLAHTAKPYSRSFANQYCKYFSPQKSLVVDYKPFLFLKPESSHKISGLSSELAELMRTELAQTFEQTPWYLAGSARKLKVDLKGNYDWKSSSELVPQVHSYNVKVPYTVWEKVKRVDTINGKRTESYDNVRATKYRQEVRTYPYYGTKKNQVFNFNVVGSSDYSSFNFAKEDKEEVIVHNYSIPEIGLVPKTQDLMSQTEKFKGFMKELNEKFKASLITGWENQFCVMPEARDKFSISENALRCRKIQTQKSVAFTNNWFENTYGITAESAVKVLGDF